MPAKEMNQHGSHAQVEEVISGGYSASDESGGNDDLKCIRHDGQYHGGSKWSCTVYRDQGQSGAKNEGQH
jgi:hypothetical protein